MKNSVLFLAVILICSLQLHAQTTLKGVIHNSVTKEFIPAVSINIKGSTIGDFSNEQGQFKITTSKRLPLTLVFSSIGFETQEVNVVSESPLKIELVPASTLGSDVVVSASRAVQRKLESPVTIERIGSKEINLSPQLSYMDMMQGLKGVDITTSSITFTTITTRGFNTSGNSNFTQITDGMDNQAPGLNFSIGSIIGPTQLDVDNVELLSGASSALYGSRGLNGAMITTSKNPFKYQGLSFMITQGVNHIQKGKGNDPLGPSPVYDWALRYAKKINDKFAFKVNLQYTQAKDWVAADTTNKRGSGSRYTDPNYDGVNLYGGATSVDINPFLYYALQMEPGLEPIIGPMLNEANYVARTGYEEYGYLDPLAKIFKVNGEIRYRITPGLEAIVSGTYGTGNTVYSNDTRYALTGFKLGQYRAELKGKNWFLRGYMTDENSGKTVIAGYTAQLINEGWKSSFDPNTGDGWYPQYTMALLQSLVGGADIAQAHLLARNFADQGRPSAGSDVFNRLKDSIINIPSSQGGTQFLDRSKLYNAEFQYDFSNLIHFVDIIGGVNYRNYKLDSRGTLFPDNEGPIFVKEYSAYGQASKKLFNDVLTLSASLRWDKNSLFEKGQTTSRFSGVLKAHKETFIRFSYQNAYSFPTNIQTLQSTLQGVSPLYYASGGSKLLLFDYYHFDQFPAHTLKSVQKFQDTQNPSDLQLFDFKDIKPQSVNAFEMGVASLIGHKVLLDVLGYYSTWKNFIGYTNVANTPGSTDPANYLDPNGYAVYNISYNNAYKVRTYGFAASLQVLFAHNFTSKINFTSDFFKNLDSSQVNNFNTPNYKFNVEFGNTGFGPKERFAFNTALRYRPSYDYEIGLAKGTVDAATIIDAQLTYKLLKAHSAVKLSATNLTNQYYRTGVGSPAIGGMYNLTFAYNIY